MSNTEDKNDNTVDAMRFEDAIQRDADSEPDYKAIMAIEKGLSESVRLLIEKSLTDGTATFETRELVGRNHVVEEKMEFKGKFNHQITPAYRVRGLTYTDGKVLGRFPTVINRYYDFDGDYSVNKVIKIANPTIVVVSDWKFGQNDKPEDVTERDPFGEDDTGPENACGNNSDKKGPFHRSLSHTIYARNKKNFDDFIGYKLAKLIFNK